MERTLVLIKPSAIQRGLAGEILSRLERRGLRIAGLKLLWMNEDLAALHYAEHMGKPFYDGLIENITSCPIVAAIFEGERAVEIVRATMGSTDPRDATPGTIRGDFGLVINRNVIHGSDSPESAAREIELFFRPDELISYERAIDRWLFEPS